MGVEVPVPSAGNDLHVGFQARFLPQLDGPFGRPAILVLPDQEISSKAGPKAGGPHYVARFATERVTCIDTTAAGGNASLMAALEG